jgi:TM2 domain-containing membrane protein YozV
MYASPHRHSSRYIDVVCLRFHHTAILCNARRLPAESPACSLRHVSAYWAYGHAGQVALRTTVQQEDGLMARQGSTGNVIAAVCSFFIPGLGQLVQGRVGMALVHFVLAGILWYFLLGWIIHVWSIIDAARFRSPPP